VRPVQHIALTIAGSDSGGGAGVQADLKTFAAHGVYGASVITAITAQNTVGISAISPVEADLVTAQIEAVMSDLGANAAKTGMLPNAAVVEAVAAAVADLEIPYLVVDPVICASSGDRLMDEEGLAVMKTELLPRAFLVTPNIPEAEALSGVTIRTDADRHEAARRIAALGPTAIVVTGGHFPSPDIVDLLYDGERFMEVRTARITGAGTHGTGCTFAAAITAQIALGRSVQEAIPLAQEYVAGAIRHAPAIGRGRGPMQHFWKR
jgi:hydroxymethylpyrimidine/phosphomethylpyrimidine kinase